MPHAAAGHVETHGVQIPTMIYGTAWKEEQTAELVAAALEAGFRGIDTANQRKHYQEAGVGKALASMLEGEALAREDLFVQTKFTYQRSQDHRLPYDPDAPIADQVEQSLESSLEHLGVEHVDALILHGPWSRAGLSDQDREAWDAMEDLHREGRVRLIGISNVAAGQLEALHSWASVEPRVVQNRTLTRPEADLEVRRFCREQGLVYQGFSLLTAAPRLLEHPVVQGVAERTGITAAAATLRLFLALDMVVLTGTTSKEHMRDDLATLDVELTDDEVDAFAEIVPVP